MKKSIESFSSRLTRNVVFTVLVIMAIISVLVFMLAFRIQRPKNDYQYRSSGRASKG